MTTPTVARNPTNGNHVGERVELGRYRTAAGVERVVYGQRVANVVRFLGTMADVFASSWSCSEDSTCRAREGS